jgi:dolichol-phosphate mannosyltransferase
LNKLENQNKKDTNLSVVIMVFNEVSTIKEVILQVNGVCDEIGENNEIIVVDDGSEDGTTEIIDEVVRNLKNAKVIHFPENRGLGYVYKTGLKEAQGEYVTFFPADNQFSPTVIKDFYELNTCADLVLGYLPNIKRSFFGLFLSKIERLIYTVLFGSIPQFQGLFMLRRKMLERFELVSEGRGWGIIMELIIRVVRNGGVIKHLPGVVFPRMVGKSKVNNMINIWSNLKQVFYLRRVF